MERDPIDSANDAKTYARAGDMARAIASLADAVQGIAAYQRYISKDQLKNKRRLGLE